MKAFTVLYVKSVGNYLFGKKLGSFWNLNNLFYGDGLKTL